MKAALHGWRALPRARHETLSLVLYLRGQRVAIVEVFDGEGPYYANAMTPDGDAKRLGAGRTLARAVSWSEEVTGFRVGAGA